MDSFPLQVRAATVVAPAPGRGPQFWTGAPSAAFDADGAIVLGYRVRNGPDTIDETVVARSADGETYETVFPLGQDHFGAQWTERPALVRFDGGWRMYVSLATPGTKHWWIGVVTAPTLEGLAARRSSPPSRGRDTAVKDPIVRLREGVWQAWLCCHLLDLPGEEDRMSSAYATSDDGSNWDWHGTVLEGRAGRWDARGARLTTILPDGRAAYDGRASAEENWFERTGLALPGRRPFVSTGEPRRRRPLPRGAAAPRRRHRIFYEARLEDETHELRTELCAPDRVDRARATRPLLRRRRARRPRRRGAARWSASRRTTSAGTRSRPARARADHFSSSASGSGASARRPLRPAIEAACDEFRPDVILREPCEYASAIAAVERGIPFVTIAISNAEGEWGATGGRGAGPAGRGGRSRCASGPSCRASPPRSIPRPTRGPTATPRPHPPGESTRELIYASFGTEAAPGSVSIRTARCWTPSTGSTSRCC